MLLHVDHDVVAGDHEQLVFSVQRKDTDTGLVSHVLDLPSAGHLVAFHVHQRTQINDGGITLHDPFKHGSGRDALHHVGRNVAECFVGQRSLAVNFHAEVVKGLAVGRHRPRPSQRRCSQLAEVNGGFAQR